MGLFGKKERLLPELLTDEEIASVVTYDSALQYLVGLSDKDYAKMQRIVAAHRYANKAESKILGVREKTPSKLRQQEVDELDLMFDPDEPGSEPKS